MTASPFAPATGVPMRLADDLELVLAPNPSPMTYLGTNTYILGATSVAVIDPGPDNADHLAAILAAIGTRSVSHIVVTHSHLDHSPLAKALSDRTGALIHAFGDSHAGRSPVMSQLASSGFAGGGEGMDWAFAPDHLLADGDVVRGADWTLHAIHTPGHIGNHLCLRHGDAIFTGDHVMGWASSLVSPPDGDMTDFMASCDKLRRIPASVYYPGHGAPVTNPAARLETLISHRKTREGQIFAALGINGITLPDLTKAVYTDVKQALFPMASRNVFAHLVDMHGRGTITAKPTLSHTAKFARKAAI